ncbi:cyclic nucleotide-binding domain-containing protein [Nostoc sp. CHAB 5715]|nr:cyclic nucleotide-binding domain-containing protein [Nostoc sp. CHAB 5715]
MGQAILVRETLPARIAILYLGQARLLGYAPGASAPDTLELLKPGSIIGWTSLLRSVPSETAIASVETLCLTLKASDFLSLLELEPIIANAFRNYCSLVEVFDLLGAELERRGKIPDNLKELATAATKQATILNLPPGTTPLQQLDPNLLWLVSSKGSNYAVGSCLSLQEGGSEGEREGGREMEHSHTPTLPHSHTPKSRCQLLLVLSSTKVLLSASPKVLTPNLTTFILISKLVCLLELWVKVVLVKVH